MSQFILSAFADEIDEKLSTQMDVLDMYHISHIEMRGVNGRNITQYSLEEAREIKKQLDARGFVVSAVGSPIGKIKITDDFAPHLELFKHTLEIAKILGTRYIRIFSFFIPRGEDPVKYRDTVMERLNRFLAVAEGSGLILLHENEKGIFGDTPKRCLDIIETMNSAYLKATFDPANFVQCDCMTYPDAFNLLENHIAYMHIKDAEFSDHGVVPAGYGDGRVKEILKALHDSSYEGFLSLEPHLGSFTGFAELEPDSPGRNLPQGGPRQFAIAVEALKKLLAEIV